MMHNTCYGCPAGVNMQADIWSLGMTIIEMATGKPPWANPSQAVFKICGTDELPPLPPTLSADAHNFLQRVSTYCTMCI